MKEKKHFSKYLESIEGYLRVVNVWDIDMLHDVPEDMMVTVGTPKPKPSTRVCLNSLKVGSVSGNLQTEISENSCQIFYGYHHEQQDETKTWAIWATMASLHSSARMSSVALLPGVKQLWPLVGLWIRQFVEISPMHDSNTALAPVGFCVHQFVELIFCI